MSTSKTPQKALDRIEEAIRSKRNFINLMNCNLKEVPIELKRLLLLDNHEVRALYLDGNQIIKIPKWLGEIGFEEIHAYYNPIEIVEEVPGLIFNSEQENKNGHFFKDCEPLGIVVDRSDDLERVVKELPGLQRLYCFDNKLKRFPESVTRLNNLRSLSLVATQIQRVPAKITRLKKLKTLNLGRNQLQEFPASIVQLEKLMTLDLKGNKIREVPREIIEMPSLQELVLTGNLIESPPQEICDQGLEAMREYFRKLDQEGGERLYEARLLIVGEPGAGKTTLMRKLKNPDYPVPSDEPSTQGINTLSLSFPMPDSDRNFTMHIWDFGGHEIQYATHQFFLSPRALYVLLCNDRLQNTRFEYWFDLIKVLGEGSPVLVVLNEQAGNVVTNFDLSTWQDYVGERVSLDHRKLNFADTSLNRFLDLRETIQKAICGLKHVGDVVPKSWKAIRDKLLDQKKNHLALYFFRDICYGEGLQDEAQQEILLQYFRDLGLVVHFNEGIFKDTIYLNPRWVLDAVYAVLTNGEVQENQGEFEEDWVLALWGQDDYLPAEQAQLLELMLKDRFEICYRVGSTNKLIAPQLLPLAKPTFTWDEANNLLFRFHFPFMPRGFMSRLIVRLHTFIEERKVWRRGMLLCYRGAKALVLERVTAKGEKVIQIQATGDPNPREDLFQIVRSEIRKLREDAFRKWPVTEQVPFETNLNLAAEYDFLRELRAEGVATFRHPGIKGDISVRKMLEGIEEKRSFNEDGRVILNVNQNVNQEASPTITINNQSNATNRSEQTNEMDQTVTVTFNLQQNWNGLASNVEELCDEVAEVDEEAAEQLAKAAAKIEAIEPAATASEADKKAVRAPMNRLARLWKKMKDPDNKLRKAIEGAEDGVEIARDLAGKYNKIAEWVALPQIPSIFTK